MKRCSIGCDVFKQYEKFYFGGHSITLGKVFFKTVYILPWVLFFSFISTSKFGIPCSKDKKYFSSNIVLWSIKRSALELKYRNKLHHRIFNILQDWAIKSKSSKYINKKIRILFSQNSIIKNKVLHCMKSLIVSLKLYSMVFNTVYLLYGSHWFHS